MCITSSQRDMNTREKTILKFKYNWYFKDKGFFQQHLASSLVD